MMQLPNRNHIDDLEKTLAKLFDSTPHKIKDFVKDPLHSQNAHQGIYAITDPTDQEVVYIGKTNDGTVEKGVADRVCGHTQKNSSLQESLGIDPGTLKTYHVRTIAIPEPGDRGLAELYGIAVCAPRGNRYGYRGVSIDLDDPFAPREFGLAKGQFVVPADFDDPLPEEILSDFEGRG